MVKQLQRIWLLLICGIPSWADESVPLEPELDPSTLFEAREYADQDGNVLRYRLLKPVEFDPAERYPLVIFLHGSGERGEDNRAQLKHGAVEFCQPERRQQFPCYVLAPQCPAGMKWANYEKRDEGIQMLDEPSPQLRLLMELVQAMLDDSAIDKNRVYLTGLSMGGYGSWDALARWPEFFAAAVPICGGGDTKTASRFSHVPVWCFHGDQDTSVPVEYSRSMIQALQSAAGTPKYTEYPGVGHDSWTETYQNEALYQWLFEQRRRSSGLQSAETQ